MTYEIKDFRTKRKLVIYECVHCFKSFHVNSQQSEEVLLICSSENRVITNYGQIPEWCPLEEVKDDTDPDDRDL